MVLSVENAFLAGGKTVVLAAGSGEQVSSTYTQKSHGLLTYFFLKGLQGEGGISIRTASLNSESCFLM